MRSFTAALVAGMLFTGTINTILNKLQDMQCVENCNSPDQSTHRNFEQPVFQTLNMFLGEALCLLVYLLHGAFKKPAVYTPLATIPEEAHADEDVIEDNIPARVKLGGYSNLLLWIPTLCDMTASSLMNVGLIYVSASVYQMLRGSVVLFTAILSTLFLGRQHPAYRWFALGMVFIGVAIVGFSSVSRNAESLSGFLFVDAFTLASDLSDKSVIGVIMVVLAQIFTAFQFVLEEKVLSKYDVEPLKAVGLEGVFGLVSVIVLLPFAYYGYGIDAGRGGYFDLPVGWSQLTQIPMIFYPGIGIIFSIAFFNFFGLSVTKSVSATSRSTIDTCRTIFIWIVSLALGWEAFSWTQVLGFSVLIYGTFVFNDIIRAPFGRVL